MRTGSIDNKWRKENIPERWKKRGDEEL